MGAIFPIALLLQTSNPLLSSSQSTVISSSIEKKTCDLLSFGILYLQFMELLGVR